MLKLPKPLFAVDLVFDTCISRVRNEDLKSRLANAKTRIASDANQFDSAVTTTSLHSFRPPLPVPQVSNDELIGVYTERMAKKDSPGYPFYEKLRNAPPHGICPLCGIGIVSTLDHHLPKSHFPTLAVVPSNLVPSCLDCNFGKSTSVPSRPEEETLHPYFDENETERWVYANLDIERKVVTFEARPPTSWSSVLRARVAKHFKTFRLAERYGSYGANELCAVKSNLWDLYGKGGESLVGRELGQRASGYLSSRLNSWQSALYAEVSSSRWFCDGGFQNW